MQIMTIWTSSTCAFGLLSLSALHIPASLNSNFALLVLIKLFQTREDISKRLSDLDKDLFRVQSQAEKLEEHLESLAAYMWSEYEMTLNQAKEEAEETIQGKPNQEEVEDSYLNLVNAIQSLQKK